MHHRKAVFGVTTLLTTIAEATGRVSQALPRTVRIATSGTSTISGANCTAPTAPPAGAIWYNHRRSKNQASTHRCRRMTVAPSPSTLRLFLLSRGQRRAENIQRPRFSSTHISPPAILHRAIKKKTKTKTTRTASSRASRAIYIRRHYVW